MAITTPVVQDPLDRVTFATSPEGSTITFVVGGDLYVSNEKSTTIGTSITFTASAPGIDVVRYEWDFGDGVIGAGNPVTHTYTVPNPHLRASLRITDSKGRHHFTAKQIYLKDTSGNTERRVASGISYSQLILYHEPALYWRLGDDGLVDQSGNGHDGTAGGGITIGSVTGALAADADEATDFDGTDDKINSSYNPYTNGTDRTFEGWANRDSMTGSDVLFAGDTGSQYPVLWFNAAGGGGDDQLEFRAALGAGSWVFTDPWPGANEWVYWALVFKETANEATLFINGEELETLAVTHSYNATPGNFVVGARGAGSDTWGGLMDEIAVYERALSAAEIQGHYEIGIAL